MQTGGPLERPTTFHQKKSFRDKLHEDLCKNGLPPLKSHELSFLGLSVQQLPDGRIFISQPESRYTQAIISGHQYRKRQTSPLPADFNSRKIPDEKSQLLDEKGKSAYLQQLMRIAWLTNSHPDLSAVVAHKQTRCAAPRVIDLEDLAHIVGYLAETSNLGIMINIRDIQPYLYVDIGHATHEDKKSHTACLISSEISIPKIVEHPSFGDHGSNVL